MIWDNSTLTLLGVALLSIAALCMFLGVRLAGIGARVGEPHRAAQMATPLFMIAGAAIIAVVMVAIGVPEWGFLGGVLPR